MFSKILNYLNSIIIKYYKNNNNINQKNITLLFVRGV